MKKKILRCLYLGLAFFFTGLGAVGVVLPILPTTPFLLLAAFLFAKGSNRFHCWFINTKLYRNHLHDFVKTGSMTLKTKWSILIPASVMLLLAFLFSPVWYARVIIVAVIIIKYVYFFTKIKTDPSVKAKKDPINAKSAKKAGTR